MPCTTRAGRAFAPVAPAASLLLIGLIGLVGPIGLDAAQAANASPGFSERQRFQSERRYMAFGDSITVGFGTSDRKTKSYPAQAGVRSYGVGGTTTIEAAEWLPTYLESHSKIPTTAIFQLGLNDTAGLGAPAEDVIHNLQKLRRIGRTHGIEVVFGTLTPSPLDSEWRRGEKQRHIVNRWIRTQPRFVEYAKALQCGSEQYLCPRFIGDEWRDVHPNDAGAKAMARVLRKWMKADRFAQ